MTNDPIENLLREVYGVYSEMYHVCRTLPIPIQLPGEENDLGGVHPSSEQALGEVSRMLNLLDYQPIDQKVRNGLKKAAYAWCAAMDQATLASRDDENDENEMLTDMRRCSASLLAGTSARLLLRAKADMPS